MHILQRFLGIATTKSIHAVLFVFQPGKSGDKAALDSCTGWVRHRGRFYESGTYTFVLNTQLSGGSAEVSLLDHSKRPLLTLSKQLPSQSITLDGKSRYYLRWEFKRASGKCELRW